MRRQLQQRAAALQLAPAALHALFARLHFATKGLTALDGPLPTLLREQWQELWPAVLAVPVGFIGDAAELEHVAGPAPVGLPAPKPADAANISEAQPAGRQPGGSTASSGGTRSRRALRGGVSNVTSAAVQATPSAPRLVAYTLEASSLWVYERLASRDANLSLVLAGADCLWLPRSSDGGSPGQPLVLRGAAALVMLSRWPSNDPAAPCSWHALLMGAAQGGAAAVLFAAPPGTGPDLQQPACAGSSSAPCGSPAIAAATVGRRFGRALQLALGSSRRVNVTFGGVRVGVVWVPGEGCVAAWKRVGCRVSRRARRLVAHYLLLFCAPPAPAHQLTCHASPLSLVAPIAGPCHVCRRPAQWPPV